MEFYEYTVGLYVASVAALSVLYGASEKYRNKIHYILRDREVIREGSHRIDAEFYGLLAILGVPFTFVVYLLTQAGVWLVTGDATFLTQLSVVSAILVGLSFLYGLRVEKKRKPLRDLSETEL